jgi:predicted O-methyltransferase YrrM
LSQETWTNVDRYISDLFIPHDPIMDGVLRSSEDANLPAINVSQVQGRFLMLLALIQGARSILEIGTLGGYSTIWLARALPSDGRLITLEIDPDHAAVARANIARAGMDKSVELRVGPALETLPQLLAEGNGPFDLIFIDADKPSYADYFAWALKLARTGTVIVADNIVRNGAVASEDSSDPRVVGIRRFNDLLAASRRVAAIEIQTVGSKGYDGLAIALVVA